MDQLKSAIELKTKRARGFVLVHLTLSQALRAYEAGDMAEGARLEAEADTVERALLHELELVQAKTTLASESPTTPPPPPVDDVEAFREQLASKPLPELGELEPYQAVLPELATLEPFAPPAAEQDDAPAPADPSVPRAT